MLSQEIRSSSIPSREPLSAAIEAALRDERRASVKQDVPCWMASFVVHVSLVLLLAMLIKPGGTHTAGWQPTLVASWSAGPQAATPDVGLTPVPPQAPEIVAEQGQNERTDASAPGQQGAEDQGSSGRESDGPDSVPPRAVAESEPQHQQEDEEQNEEEDLELLDALVDDHRYSPAFGEHLMPSRSTSRRSMDNRITYAATSSQARREPQVWGNADAIVRAFIQYDTGRLRGRAGSVAKQQFARLGPESIPALVRGLNYSANLSASCPVGVISSRLTSLLRQSDDPAALQYAINNLGRGVRSNAPHHRRLTTLRNAIISKSSRARPSRDTYAGRGTSPARRGSQRTQRRPEPRDPWRLAP